MNASKQPIYLRTGLFVNIILIALVCVALCFALHYYLSPNVSPWNFGIYLPPANDKTAVLGTPSEDATVGFDYVNEQIANGLIFQIASNLYMQKDGTITVLLTNPQGSGVSLLCAIEDAKTGKVLAKSGRILPGYYVTRLRQRLGWKNKYANIHVTIYAIDPVTSYSRGTIQFDTVLHPW